MKLTFRPQITIDFPEECVQMEDDSLAELEIALGNIVEGEVKNTVKKLVREEIQKTIEADWEYEILPTIKNWIKTEKGKEFIESVITHVSMKRVENKTQQLIEKMKKGIDNNPI